MDLIENLKTNLRNTPTIIEESTQQLKALSNLNLTSKGEVAKQLVVDKVLTEKLVYAAGNVIYKQNNQIESLTEKLINVGEYDPKEVEKFMARRQKMETNKIQVDKVRNLILEELRLKK